MKNIATMSIDELQDLLGKVTDPTSASPAEAVLQSKSILYLSNEIAIFKEAMALESRAMRESSDIISKKLVEIVQAVGSTSERLLEMVQAVGLISQDLKTASENAEKVSRVQIKQTYAMIGLTAALVFATLIMGGIGYFQMQEAQKLTKATQEQVSLTQKQTQIMYADYIHRKSSGSVEAVYP